MKKTITMVDRSDTCIDTFGELTIEPPTTNGYEVISFTKQELQEIIKLMEDQEDE